MGLAMYMDLDALHRLMREGDVASGALLLIDPASEAALSQALKALPAVAGAGFKRAVLQSFRETMAANMNLSILINLVFASVIAFGVVYNAARVSLSERSHELASLRVLGFTRAEISLILLGELALLTLAALPVGARLRLRAVGRSSSRPSRARYIAFRCMSHARPWPGRFSVSSARRSSRRCSCAASSTRSISSRC